MADTPATGKMSLGQMLFGLSGRIRRRDFWIYSCVNAAAWLVVNTTVLAAIVIPLVTRPSPNLPWWFNYAMITAMAPFLWIGVALNIKRLHDIGRSYRWWRMNLIPVFGWVWTFIECGLRDGTPGPNLYGPSPKGMLDPEKVFE